MLAMFASDYARADGPAAGLNDTIVANPYTTLAFDTTGTGAKEKDGSPKLGKLTLNGVNAPSFTTMQNPDGSIRIIAVTMLGADKPNQNAAKTSYIQCALVVGTLKSTGFAVDYKKDFVPREGERACNLPQANAVTPQGAEPILASIIATEHNGNDNNNPQLVVSLHRLADGTTVPTKNNNVDANRPELGTNLVQAALAQGINVPNPGDQRGTMKAVVGSGKPGGLAKNNQIAFVQYNNQALEAFSYSIAADNAVKVNWFKRISDDCRHCRPDAALLADEKQVVTCAVKANTQPGYAAQCAILDVATGAIVKQATVAQGDQNKKQSIGQPSVVALGNPDCAYLVSYTRGAKLDGKPNGGDGHMNNGVSSLAAARCLGADLQPKGPETVGVGPVGSHTKVVPYGAGGIAVMGAPAIGTKNGFLQTYSLDGSTLSAKSANSLVSYANFADSATCSRGLRNPNNQGRCNLATSIVHANPFAGIANGFMTDFKQLTLVVGNGYKDATAATLAKRQGLWLSVVPTGAAPGIQVVPGSPTGTPSVDANGNPSVTGPAPRIKGASSQAADPNVLSGTEATSPDDPTGSGSRGRGDLGSDAGGCAVSSGSTSNSNNGLLLVAVAGVILALRRKQEEV